MQVEGRTSGVGDVQLQSLRVWTMARPYSNPSRPSFRFRHIHYITTPLGIEVIGPKLESSLYLLNTYSTKILIPTYMMITDQNYIQHNRTAFLLPCYSSAKHRVPLL